jgi:hypothetical protein
MVKIHHASAKLAAKNGLELVLQTDDTVAAHFINGALVATGETGKIALERALAKVNGEDDDFEDDGELAQEASDEIEAAEAAEEEEVDRSIVKTKYKAAYKLHKNTCGDQFVARINECVKVKVPVINKKGKTRMAWRIGPVKLQKLAIANDVWKPSYASLNMGQRRMTIGVRLRNLAKDGNRIEWTK